MQGWCQDRWVTCLILLLNVLLPGHADKPKVEFVEGERSRGDACALSSARQQACMQVDSVYMGA